MIPFLKFRKVYALISAIVIAIGLIAVISGGLRPSIEFTGGTNLEYQFTRVPNIDKLRGLYEQNGIEVADLSAQEQKVRIRTKPMEREKESAVRSQLEKEFNTEITVLRSETVGPVLGRELIEKTIIAAVIGVFVILAYVSFAFRNLNFALAAIGALFHDILVVVGMYALLGQFGAEVDSLFVTALLTTMSFSVHDTIVIFDKIREYRRERGTSDVEANANRALTETMVRSVNNSMTIVFMLLALTLLGGSTIRFFVAALLIGTITGTYSSPFVATPLLLLLENRRKNKTNG